MACTLRVGLTGGIASGKSEASRRFAALGVPVIDTDVIARELVAPGQPALAEITARFGQEILDDHGVLDRARLRRMIFTDASRRRELESILHPRIREHAIAEADRRDSPYCIIVIPLLVETARDYPLDRILVVDAPAQLQIQRLTNRDRLSEAEISAILHVQADRDTRLQAADDVLTNDGSIEDLHRQIDNLHVFYLELASSRRQPR